MAQHRSYEPVATSEELHVSQPETASTEAAAGQTPDELTTHSTVATPDDRPSTPPPPYSAVYVPLPVIDTDESPELPPSYGEATVKLPTYEEASEGRHSVSNARLTLDTGTEKELGSDCTFATCFFFAFAFNWIGFLAGYCMTSTFAGHYGAIAGFGLSVVKWSWIMKNSSHKDLIGAPWIWWMFIATGWLLFMRGFLVYLHVRLLARKGRIFASRPLDTATVNSHPN